MKLHVPSLPLTVGTEVDSGTKLVDLNAAFTAVETVVGTKLVDCTATFSDETVDGATIESLVDGMPIELDSSNVTAGADG